VVLARIVSATRAPSPRAPLVLLAAWSSLLLLPLVTTGADCINKCQALADQMCADLGPEDCALVASDPKFVAGILPPNHTGCNVANGMCSAAASDEGYRGYVRPLLAYRIALHRHPETHPSPPQLIDFRELTNRGDGFPYFLFPVVAIPAVLVWSFLARRRLRSR
jgi:hypothetical protein